MRIIRGIYGRRRFQVPTTFSARPTTDFAKENLFNVLENLITWQDVRALDLFSGTGSIAFELLSRGCNSVTAVEANRAHAAFIADVARRLSPPPGTFTLIRGDAFRYLRTAPAFPLIFADPPYSLPRLPELPEVILGGQLLCAGGLFILEHPGTYDFSTHSCFSEMRVYGAVHFSLFRAPEFPKHTPADASTLRNPPIGSIAASSRTI